MVYETLSLLLEHKLALSKHGKLLVGVSGGPDSIMLLDSLHNLGYSVLVAHYDHQLREDSSNDALFVEKLAQNRGLDVIVETGNTSDYANEKKLSVEEAARELRYSFLFRQAEKHNVSAVVVGHTADDQVETVLMHLIRGSGLDGLVGMELRVFTRWSPTIPLVRPLLGFWRQEILDYLCLKNIEARDDQSNLDPKYFRNRLRHELIPALKDYNPRFKESILRMSETVSEDKKILDGEVEEFMSLGVKEKSASHLGIDLAAFLDMPLGLQRRILRRAIQSLRSGLRDIGFDAIEHTLNALRNPTSTKQADLIAGLRLQIEDDRFILSEWVSHSVRDEWPQANIKNDSTLLIPGNLILEKDWTIKSAILVADPEVRKAAYTNKNPFVAYVDFDCCEDKLHIRNRRAGDRFRPLGMEGKSVKLSDFMINNQLAQRARKHWPLVFSGNNLIWVPGFQISDDVRVSERTKKILQLSVERSAH